jgi:hypothetical protein
MQGQSIVHKPSVQLYTYKTQVKSLKQHHFSNCKSLGKYSASIGMGWGWVWEILFPQCLFPVVSSCRVNLQAVGLLLMWMMILSHAPLMILVFDP